MKDVTARSEQMAGSPEAPPWGVDRKVPPQLGDRPGEELARENQAEQPEATEEHQGERSKEAEPGQKPRATILDALAPPSALIRST